jgi:hypothetical protein
MAKMRTGRMSEPPVTGKALSKTKITAPNSKPTGEQLAIVAKAGDKNKQRQAEAAAAPKPMSKGKKAAIIIGGAAALVGKKVYDVYHEGISSDYHTEYGYGSGSGNKGKYPYGEDPSNKELRKWKKGQ